MDKDITGEECQVCRGEFFRLFPRKAEIAPGISIDIKCCPGCTKRIDSAFEDEATKEAAKELDKKERKIFWKKKSFQWADSLHGKKVIVFWQEGIPPVLFNKPDPHRPKSFKPPPINQVRGIAYRTNNASGGWGRVKVILSQEEERRVIWVLGGLWDSAIVPIIDNQRNGLGLLPTKDERYYTLVSWGEKHTISLNETEKGDSTPP